MSAKGVPIRQDDIGPIERGVPIPKPRAGARGASKYPFAQMKVGDSFTVAKEMEARIRTMASVYGPRHPPMRFMVRVDGTRVRVWRIK